jgi:hypothetical protein
MATPEERKQKLDAVNEKLRRVTAINVKDLGRRSELTTTINFEDAIPALEEMFDLVRQLEQRDLARLSVDKFNTITGACDEILKRVEEIRTFDIATQSNAGKACKDIIARVKNSYDQVLDQLIIPLAFTATQATDFARIEREAMGFHTRLKEKVEKTEVFIEKKQKEMTAALDAVKAVAAEAGVVSNAQIFEENSGSHSGLAQRWFKGTIAMTAITFVAAVGLFIESFIYQPQGVEAIIQHIIGKLIVLSVLSYGVFWCARNYRAHKHNQTLNKHRANALKTFKAFVSGSSDERIKDAVLLQASQACFLNRPTGYDSAEPEPQCINPVIDVIGKSITGAP